MTILIQQIVLVVVIIMIQLVLALTALLISNNYGVIHAQIKIKISIHLLSPVSIVQLKKTATDALLTNKGRNIVKIVFGAITLTMQLKNVRNAQTKLQAVKAVYTIIILTPT